MKKIYLFSVVLFLSVLIVKTTSAQTNIDFESETINDQEEPNTSTLTMSYSGYSFTAVGSQVGMYGGIYSSNGQYATAIDYGNNKYFYMGMQNGGNITKFTITRQDKGLFNFYKIDLAPMQNPAVYDEPFNISIQGYKNGKAVTSLITKSTVLHGTGAYEDKVTFDESANTAFQGIDAIQVTLNVNSDYYALDNLLVESVTGTPVTISNFTGSFLQANMATLVWNSGVEDNFSQYELQKSADAVNFEKVVAINAKGSGKTYKYDIAQPGNIAYYRLKLINNSGTFTYSKTLKLVNDNSSESSIYPNPAHEKLNFVAAQSGDLQIFDASGKLVKKLFVQKGANDFSIAGLPSGIYFVQQNGNRLRFIKK